jgi:hypothetical protein
MGQHQELDQLRNLTPLTLDDPPGVPDLYDPIDITASVSGHILTLFWPVNNPGWSLQPQTSDCNAGLSSPWPDLPGTEGTNSVGIFQNPVTPGVFYRLRAP